MKVVCISDTHTMATGKNPLPDGDLLIHAGDATFKGTDNEVKAFLKWMESQPHKHKVFVPGNHDLYFDEKGFPHNARFRSWKIYRYFSVKEMMERYAPSVHLLIDRAVEIEGFKVYGSPWQPWFWDWGFNFPANVEMTNRYAPPAVQHDREVAARKWAEIPDDVQILATHSPPKGILDAEGSKWDAEEDDRLGCPELRKRIELLPSLRLHVFGHIHEGYGQYVGTNEYGEPQVFVNAAINTRDYQPINPPIVVEIE